MRNIFVSLMLLFSTQVCAAEFWIAKASEKSPALNVVLEGRIQAGDSDLLQALLKDKGPYVETLFLYSPGGDVVEAMKIGQLVRALQIETRGPTPYYPPSAKDDQPYPQCNPQKPKSTKNCVCNSSCFLVWVAGVNRHESYLGIHRPSYEKQMFASLSADKAEEKYEAALRAMDDYLAAYSVPQDMRERMRSTPSRDIYQFISPASMNGFVPAYDELINSRCNLLTKIEDSRYWVLHFKVKQSRASYDETLEYAGLKKRFDEVSLCQAFQAIAMRVEAFSKYYGVDYAKKIQGR